MFTDLRAYHPDAQGNLALSKDYKKPHVLTEYSCPTLLCQGKPLRVSIYLGLDLLV